MVKKTTEGLLVKFGNYLLSEERYELFKSHPGYPSGELLEERLRDVHDSDISNFKEKLSGLERMIFFSEVIEKDE